MRVLIPIGTTLAIALMGMGAAVAADTKGTKAAPTADASQLPVPVIPGRQNFFSEVRLGGFAHDPDSKESGSVDFNGEILFAKPFTAADLFTSYFIPRPHIGTTLNFNGRTSMVYAGLTWSYDITPWLFVEGSFGGAVHNGNTSSNAALVAPNESALGCSPLFRESASVGVRFSANWSLMATVEHASNAGLCTFNRGLTNFGARVGYTF